MSFPKLAGLDYHPCTVTKDVTPGLYLKGYQCHTSFRQQSLEPEPRYHAKRIKVESMSGGGTILAPR